MKIISDKNTFDVRKGNWSKMSKIFNNKNEIILNSVNQEIQNNTNEFPKVLKENNNLLNIKDENENLFYDIINNEEKIYKENVSDLLIYILTWNMKGNKPNDNDLPKLFPFNSKEELNKIDIFVIGTQECLHSIAVSFLVNSKEEWEKRIANYLGDNYINIASSNLNSFHLCIFAKIEKIYNITNIMVGEIKSGFFNIIGNKGAVAASFEYRRKKILFISCHLDSGEDKCEKRNQSISRINDFLELNYSTYYNDLLNEKKSLKNNKYINEINKDIVFHTKNYDIIFFFGDLNYRLNTDIKTAKNLIENSNIKSLLEKDQLIDSFNKKSTFLNNYQEDKINFLPTFKFIENSNNYDYSLRVPSWTDRVIFKTKLKNDLNIFKYDSIENVYTSDHKPVYSIFQIKINEIINLKAADNNINNDNECKIM